jgi:hypothetical protein
MMVSSSSRLRPGYLSLRVLTALVMVATHSSVVLYSQFTVVRMIRSGLSLFFAQGETIGSFQMASLGSAQKWTKPWWRLMACQRASSLPDSKPAPNQSPVTDTPMTWVQTNSPFFDAAFAARGTNRVEVSVTSAKKLGRMAAYPVG